MAVDLSVPESGWDPAFYYWLASVGYLTYAGGNDEVLKQLIRVPGPARFGRLARSGAGGIDAVWADYGDWMLVSVQGTDDWLHVIRHLHSSPQIPFITFPRAVHFQWLLDADHLWNQLLSSDAFPLPGRQTRKVLFTGHSLGGAVAQIMAHRINGAFWSDVKGVVTFGSPKPGNLFFSLANTWPVIRVEDTADPVPYLPPGTGRLGILRPFRFVGSLLQVGYEHAGVGMTLGTSVAANRADLREIQAIVAAPLNSLYGPGSMSAIQRHLPAHYIRSLRQHLRVNLEHQPSRFPKFGRVDAIVGPLLKAAGLVWNWPTTFPVVYIPGSSTWSTARNAVRYQRALCLGRPGTPCCGD